MPAGPDVVAVTKPFWRGRRETVWQGDAWQLAAKLEPGPVDCIVTSPPYWGQRDYALPPIVLGGKPECKHEWGHRKRKPLTTQGAKGAGQKIVPGNCRNYVIAFLLRRQKPQGCVQTAPRQGRRKLRKPPLVLAHEFQKLLDDGVVNSRADIARRYGITRARVTQIMGLLRLPTAVQEQLLALPEEKQAEYPERRLRTIAALRTLAARSRAFERLPGRWPGSGQWQDGSTGPGFVDGVEHGKHGRAVAALQSRADLQA